MAVTPQQPRDLELPLTGADGAGTSEHWGSFCLLSSQHWLGICIAAKLMFIHRYISAVLLLTYYFGRGNSYLILRTSAEFIYKALYVTDERMI